MKTYSTRMSLALLPLIFATIAPRVRGEMFSGSVDANGRTVGAIRFFADSGNMNYIIVSQTVAVGLGLGTLNPNGTFTAPAGTPSGPINNGAYTVWVFQATGVFAQDTGGLACGVADIPILVAQNQGENPGEAKGNKHLAVKNVLNHAWLSRVGACLDIRTGDGFWFPGWTPPPARRAAVDLIDPATGVAQQTFTISLQGPVDMLTLPMTVSSVSPYTFVPQSVAATLGLQIDGSVD
jgi:hypothetical protein